ncbi:cytochrome P450 2J6-like [Saccostrea echinata]|uniref:cytochrome P450 2J6-like n=1 Tax=Saccostrea echinata TaxID=191078 RepID=UPI002A7FE002|nr:cytochrome P450 2J6-like [Saccostrea echinata]
MTTNSSAMFCTDKGLGESYFLKALGAMTSKTKKKKFPPGPTGIPFFGCFFDIDLKNLHLDFMKWKEQYGNIVSFKMNGKNFLVLNTVDVIRKAFTSDDIGPLMSDRPLNFMGEYIAFGYKDVLLRRYDEDFSKMKELMIRSMKLHDLNSNTFRELMSEELSHVLAKFQKTEGKSTDPLEILMPSFCNIIGMMFTGRRCKDEDKLLKTLIDFDRDGDTMIQPQVHSVFKLFPWIRYFPGFYGNLYRRVIHGRSELHNVIRDMKMSFDKNNVRNFIHELLREHQEYAEDSENAWLTDEHILGMVMDLINTSVLTTKAVMSGVLFLLVHFPEVQEKIRKEINMVIGDREPDIADMTSMPYTQACMMEILRYQSHLPLTAAHANLSQEVELEGFSIPKGTVIFGNLFACHHDESIYSEPWSFKPERFLENGKLVSSDHPARQNFVGFGIGKRYCVGQQMAKSRMFLYTTSLVQKFKIEVPNDMVLPSYDPRALTSESPVILPPAMQYCFVEI